MVKMWSKTKSKLMCKHYMFMYSIYVCICIFYVLYALSYTKNKETLPARCV